MSLYRTEIISEVSKSNEALGLVRKLTKHSYLQNWYVHRELELINQDACVKVSPTFAKGIPSVAELREALVAALSIEQANLLSMSLSYVAPEEMLAQANASQEFREALGEDPMILWVDTYKGKFRLGVTDLDWPYVRDGAGLPNDLAATKANIDEVQRIYRYWQADIKRGLADILAQIK